MYTPSSQVSIATTGIAFGALVDYVSSPSSVSSYMSYDIPQMLISTGGRSWTQTQTETEEDDSKHGTLKQILWLKKPRRY